MIAQQIVLDAPGLVRRMLLVGTGPSGGRRHAGIFARGYGYRQSSEQHYPGPHRALLRRSLKPKATAAANKIREEIA
jgi:hypothetical protein